MKDYHPLDTHYFTKEYNAFVPYYCGQTMLKWPWRPELLPWKTCAVRGQVHPDLDTKLVKRFINSVQRAYEWKDVEIALDGQQLTCTWKTVPKIWQELYLLLSLIRLPFEHPYALIQYEKIRKFLPRDVALAFCSCYDGYHIGNHLLRTNVFQQQHLVDFSFETIIKKATWEISAQGVINEIYGSGYGISLYICNQHLEMTPKIYEFLLKQQNKESGNAYLALQKWLCRNE